MNLAMDPKDVERALAITMQMLWRWEGMVLEPYLCSAGVPTIGLGSTRYLDGRAVQLTDPAITRDHAVIIARDQVRATYMRAVRGLCPNVTRPSRVAALTSLAYNVGAGAFRASTLRKRINDERWSEVPLQWRRWNRAGGRVLRGLNARRAAELELWNKGGDDA